ncbi:phosphatase PAP2 family protein [Bradyrhizobium manausense]|nr:phosphatase PAP2 family protein [Bradyrhizobium manausense]UVO33447.1 phosphatase PAP2 family protein [Bradyrhizobium arachidis]
MAVSVRPTSADVAIARLVAGHANPTIEAWANIATWGADEHVLCGLALGWWLWTRRQDRTLRCAGDHILVTTLAASLLPHALKTEFDQERPDRLTVAGHLRGVPYSGNQEDAFPSGHAIHIGALASAACELPSKQRNIVWAIGAALASTRIVLLAHWTSDVLTGLVVGVGLERLLRPLTGFGKKR